MKITAAIMYIGWLAFVGLMAYFVSPHALWLILFSPDVSIKSSNDNKKN